MFRNPTRMGWCIVIALAIGLCDSEANAKKPPEPPADDSGAAYAIIPFMPEGSQSTFSTVAGINEEGQAVGTLEYAGGDHEAIHLDIASGVYTTLVGGGRPLGINNLNQIVGRDAASGLFWSGPSALPLSLAPLPGDLASSAEGINDAGIVFGVSEGLVNGEYAATCVVWRVYLDQNEVRQVDGPKVLPPLHTVTWWPYDINEVVNGAAQVVGESDGEAVLWTVEVNADGTLAEPGTPTSLRTLEDLGASWSAGYGINCFADVCGKADALPFVAPVGQECQSLPLPPKALYGNAFDINCNGDVVGYAVIEVRKQATKFAQLWQGGQQVDLTSQIPSDSGWERLSSALVVNNSGIIAGGGVFDVPQRGFLMIPVTP